MSWCADREMLDEASEEWIGDEARGLTKCIVSTNWRDVGVGYVLASTVRADDGACKRPP